MNVTAASDSTTNRQYRFFMASTCASMLVFAALAAMVASMNSATRPLPAETLMHASAHQGEALVVGMNTVR